MPWETRVSAELTCRHCGRPIYGLLGQWRHVDSNTAVSDGHAAGPGPVTGVETTECTGETIRLSEPPGPEVWLHPFTGTVSIHHRGRVRVLPYTASAVEVRAVMGELAGAPPGVSMTDEEN